MKAIIMAGGLGTRLRPVCGDTPKPLARLLGRPLIEHTVFLLREQGFTELMISLGHGAQEIISALRSSDCFGPDIRFSPEDRPLGTAGGVRLAWERFCKGDRVLVISGDAACDLELSRLWHEHDKRRPAVTLALHRRENPLGCGLVVTQPDGRVISFIEKPCPDQVVTDRVNTGIYVLSPQALELIPRDVPFDFARGLFPLLLGKGLELFGVELPGYWCDAGTPGDYFRCNLDALSGKLRLCRPWGKYSPEEPAPPPQKRRFKESTEVPCAHPAAVMRLLSESLAGFGADFTDGLSLENGLVRISPAPERSAITIGAAGENARTRCKKYALLAKSLEETAFSAPFHTS